MREGKGSRAQRGGWGAERAEVGWALSAAVAELSASDNSLQIFETCKYQSERGITMHRVLIRKNQMKLWQGKLWPSGLTKAKLKQDSFPWDPGEGNFYSHCAKAVKQTMREFAFYFSFTIKAHRSVWYWAGAREDLFSVFQKTLYQNGQCPQYIQACCTAVCSGHGRGHTPGACLPFQWHPRHVHIHPLRAGSFLC